MAAVLCQLAVGVRRLTQQPVHALGQRFWIAAGHQYSVLLMGNQLGGSLTLGRDDRDPVMPGLEDDVTERLVTRRTDKYVSQPIIARRVILPSGPSQLMGDTKLIGLSAKRLHLRSIADNQKNQTSPVDLFRDLINGLEMVGKTLVDMQPTGSEHDDVIG